MPSAKEKETRNTLACKGSFKMYIQIICAKHVFITGLFSSSLGASYFAVSNEQGFDLNQSAALYTSSLTNCTHGRSATIITKELIEMLIQ
jgi:hypothetical protein